MADAPVIAAADSVIDNDDDDRGTVISVCSSRVSHLISNVI